MKDIIGIVGKIEIQDVYNSIVSVRNPLSFKIILCLYRRRSLFLRDTHWNIEGWSVTNHQLRLRKRKKEKKEKESIKQIWHNVDN